MMGNEPFVPTVTAAEVQAGIEHGEFAVHYQPVISLHTGKLLSAEGLVRWRHPTLGMLAPGMFLPAVADAGLLAELGAWVLRTVCAQARIWQDAGIAVPCVGFNPSEEDLRPAYLRDLVRAALDGAGIGPRLLVLELHEEVMADTQRAAQTLGELAALGVRLWIDDYGTGPSSLPLLEQFPFEILKIDRGDVSHIAEDPGAESAVASMIELAQSMGMAVVAEGVVTQDQLAVLRRHGCDHIQGRLFSRPLEADALSDFLVEGHAKDIDPLHMLRQ
jgi:EAL domain-containing protein (putative c-di-GMP-specific phosphodiesterase class I)